MVSESFQITDTDQARLLKCMNYMDISQAARLHDCLQQLIGEKPAHVMINGAEIDAVDTAILQTLYAFIRDARLAGIDVSWQQHNDVVRQAAELLGMTTALGLSSGQCEDAISGIA